MNILKKLSRWWSDDCADRLTLYCQQPISASRNKRSTQRAAVEFYRDSQGETRHVRIGSWRVIAASQTRRIVEVRQLPTCQRVAVKIELHDGGSLAPTCSIWELYDLQGSLLAMLQTTGEQDYWITTDFQTGRVARSSRDIPVSLSA